VRAARVLVVLLVAGALGVVAAPGAHAHASLVRSDPAAGSVLTARPTTVTLTFDEPVEESDSAIRVLDDTGARVDTGPVTAVAGGGAQVAVALVPDLRGGTYTVAWTVSSADTHPVQGRFVFAIDAPSADGSGVPTAGRNDAAGLLLGILRWVGFVGLVLGPGLVLVVLLLWPAGLTDRRTRRLALGGVGLLVVSTLGGMLLQGVWASGASLTDIWADPDSLDTHSRKFDLVYAWRSYLLLLFGAGLGFALTRAGAAVARAHRPLLVAACVSTVALIATWPLVSHAAVGTAPVAATVANLLHTFAMCVWVGGLVLISCCLPPASHADVLTSALPRFSRLAFGCVVTLVVTGSYLAWREVGSIGGLSGTDYGRVLLVKLSGVVVLVLLGNSARVWVKRRLISSPVPVGGPSAGEPVVSEVELQRFRSGVVLEVVVAVFVLAVTAALVVIGPGP
jgi:copper transport protein